MVLLDENLSGHVLVTISMITCQLYFAKIVQSY